MRQPEQQTISSGNGKIEDTPIPIPELNSSKQKSEFYINQIYAHELQHLVTTIQQYYYEIEHPGVNSKNILKYIQGQVLPLVNSIHGVMYIATKQPLIYPVTEEIDCSGYVLARIMSTVDGKPYLMAEQAYVQPEYRTGRLFLHLLRKIGFYGERFMVQYIQFDTRSKQVGKMLERFGFSPLHMTYIREGSINNFTTEHPIFKHREVNIWAVDQLSHQKTL